MPRLQPAPFDVSRLAPLSSSVQRSLVRLNQQQRRRSLPLPRLLPSGDLFSESFPERLAVHFCSNRSRVVSCFSATKLEGIRRQSSEDTAARGGKRQVMFLPLSNGSDWHPRRTVQQVPSPLHRTRARQLSKSVLVSAIEAIAANVQL